MKKAFLLFTCCAFMVACGGNTSSTETNADLNSTDAGTTSPEPLAGGGTGVPATGARLIEQSDCIGCHKIDQKVLGPAYKAVAEKYEGKDIDYLASKIMQGSKGVWGQVEMPPHPGLSKEDAQAMAAYIVSLKK